MRYNPSHLKSHTGYTLLEMSIVLLILSLAVAGMLSITNQNIRREKIAETQRRMDVIEQALYDFRVKNNRLPCPGIFAWIGDSTFGYAKNSSIVGGSDCDTGYQGDGVFYYGDVPVRDLGLAVEYAFDGWGNRFFYTTLLNSDKLPVDFSKGTNFSTSNTASTFGIKDLNNTIILDKGEIIALVYSFGPNGHGGVGAGSSGGGLVRKNSGSTNLFEQSNCMDSILFGSGMGFEYFYTGPYTTDPTDSRNTFDDIVRYYPRSFWYTNAEKYP